MWVISLLILLFSYFEIYTRSGIFLMVRNLPNLVPKHSSYICEPNLADHKKNARSGRYLKLNGNLPNLVPKHSSYIWEPHLVDF